MKVALALSAAVAAVLVGCGGEDRSSAEPAPAATTATPPAADAQTATPATTAAATRTQRSATTAATSGPRLKTIATGLRSPWGLTFLPGGDALVGERDSGRILRVPAGGGTPKRVMTIAGVAHQTGGEDGLLGLATSPHYRSDHLIYAYYSTAQDNRIVRFTLGGKPRTVLTGLRHGVIHNGGRIAFGPDGMLYAGVGETGDGGLAQDPASRNGKILRMTPSGGVPKDNPTHGSLVYSLGHRNVQGLAWDAEGRLWASEFGQDRFDEVNQVRAGSNGGWPTVEGVGDTHGGRFSNPAVTWPTDQASPSGAAIKGSTMYIGALQGRALLRVRLDGTSARKLTPTLTGHGRIRTVVLAPDGTLWITTSNTDGRGSPASGDDRIYRLRVA